MKDKVLRYLLLFSTLFTKGNYFCYFLFTSLKRKTNRVYSLRKEFAPLGANSFLKELTPIEKSQNENDSCFP